MTTLYCSQGHSNPADSRFCRLCGESLVATEPHGPFASEPMLGWRYRVLHEVGHGGFGRTYLAEDTHRFDERCVLKEFAPQVQGTQALQKAQELFAREAGILYQLQHPQIPRFRELFRAEWQGRDRLFLVQDYVEGPTYQALIQARRQQGTTFSEAEVTDLLKQLLPVLAYIHSVGVIHRDISPDNLICRKPDGLPVLIDFGGVKQVAAAVVSQFEGAIAPHQSSSTTRLGKAGYAPVEQMVQGTVFPHSDLYALAVTSLVLLIGKEPNDVLANGRQHWQREAKITPAFSRILEQMLDPAPDHRYQSADDVLAALSGPPSRQQSEPRHRPYAAPANSHLATVAVAPSPARTAHPTASAASPPTKRHRSGGGGRTLAILALVAAATVAGTWAGTRWLIPALRQKLPDIIQSNQQGRNEAPPDNPDDPALSSAEQERKRTIKTRREDLGIEHGFLVKLTNDEFYRQHPELGGRQLKTDATDEPLRADWDQTALQLLDQLKSLSATSRNQLGRYTNADLEKRREASNQLNLSSRALNDLADAQFFYLFPEQPRNENLLDQPIGQVWHAIADDQLKELQAGKTLERVQFPPGRFSQQMSGTLKPGSGKAFIAELSKDQAIRLQLQDPNPGVLLSLYPPLSKSRALLEDSKQANWSGRLTESGFYEIVVVSDTSKSANYTIDLAAADNIDAFSN